MDSNPNLPLIEGHYLHCMKCFNEDEHPQSLEVLFGGGKVQVWCKRHNCNITTFDTVETQDLECQHPEHKHEAWRRN